MLVKEKDAMDLRRSDSKPKELAYECLCSFCS